MTDHQPWWVSGGEEAVEPSPEPKPDGALDWGSLATGAQRLVDWATERVMGPHAEHQDPSAHPDCMVCRAMLLIGESGATGATLINQFYFMTFTYSARKAAASASSV